MIASGGELERVVTVRVPAAEGRSERRDEVGRDEERTPSLVLADVNQLVDEGRFVDVVHTQHHVAEGDRAISPPEATGPRRALAQEDPPMTAAPLERETEQCSDERPRRGPQQTEPLHQRTDEPIIEE